MASLDPYHYDHVGGRGEEALDVALRARCTIPVVRMDRMHWATGLWVDTDERCASLRLLEQRPKVEAG
jgi:hypothetical protein